MSEHGNESTNEHRGDRGRGATGNRGGAGDPRSRGAERGQRGGSGGSRGRRGDSDRLQRRNDEGRSSRDRNSDGPQRTGDPRPYRNRDSERGSGPFRDRDGGRPRSEGSFRASRRPRGGQDRFRDEHDGMSREDVRELERATRPGLARKEDEPPTPTDVDEKMLPRQVRAELRSLPKDLASIVGAYLVMAGELIDDDPQLALSHAQAARRRAARLSVVREATAEAAYAAGDWATALTEYRALHRMSGAGDYLPVMADCERALGRPREALKLARESQAVQLDPAMRLEMTIVEAGARADLGEIDEALRLLLDARTRQRAPKAAQARLAYAAADLFERTNHRDAAVEAFSHAVDLDEDEVLDAGARLARMGVATRIPEQDLDIIAMMDEDEPDEDEGGDEADPSDTPVSDQQPGDRTRNTQHNEME